MTETFIKKKAVAALQAEGWVVWCAPRVRYVECDIWGVFDGAAIRGFHFWPEVLFVQWTSAININARIRKIEAWKKEHRIVFTDRIRAEVWGWHPKRREFIRRRV